jgi:hypothetical protein
MEKDLNTLTYEELCSIYPDGSDDTRVVGILRKKRETYLKKHPEEQVASGASNGVITYDGRVIPKSVWVTATPSEIRGALVGSTCFHYNSDTPGMDSDSKDRF